jgi:tagatose 1,6-diphosphate aldolase GatY/KbaY
MPLVTSKQLLLDAQAGRYAVGAFNVENMEMVQAVVAAAEELRAPVILQTTPSTVKYADVDYFYANVSTAAKKAAVPVVMHLDHGSSFGLAMQAFRAGYTSIMIDGSPKPFAENISLTKSVVDACHSANIPVEQGGRKRGRPRRRRGQSVYRPPGGEDLCGGHGRGLSGGGHRHGPRRL